MRRPPPARKSRRPLQDLVLLLEPLHLPPQPGQLGGLGLLPRHGLGRAGREVLVAPAPELVGMDPEFLGDLLQGLAALRQPLDRLGLVLGREPAPLPLLHRSFPVLVDPTLRGCPPSRGRLTASTAWARSRRRCAKLARATCSASTALAPSAPGAAGRRWPARRRRSPGRCPRRRGRGSRPARGPKGRGSTTGPTWSWPSSRPPRTTTASPARGRGACWSGAPSLTASSPSSRPGARPGPK